MSEQPETLILTLLRRVAADLVDTRQRLTALEIQFTHLVSIEEDRHAEAIARFDRIEQHFPRSTSLGA